MEGKRTSSGPHTTMTNYRGRYWHTLDDGRIQCDLCPRDCRLHEGQRGACFVRQRVDDAMVLTTYGRISGFCSDSIEKKPLNHFYPGSSVFSFGTAGCNLACKFCQNWDISKSREMDTLMDQASPETIARTAARLGCRSVAFTYNDPVIFAEYAMDAADACHEQGLAADPAGDTDAGARDRTRQRPAVCLYRQCAARPRGRHHLLPRLRRAADCARLARDPRLRGDRQRPVRPLRHGDPRPLRGF